MNEEEKRHAVKGAGSEIDIEAALREKARDPFDVRT